VTILKPFVKSSKTLYAKSIAALDSLETKDHSILAAFVDSKLLRKKRLAIYG
jgi:hypothetical protein